MTVLGQQNVQKKLAQNKFIPKQTENKMFSEAYRVLKPGGHFYLSTPYRHFLSNLFDPAYWLIGHRHYSKEQIEHFAQQANFSINNLTIRLDFGNHCNK